MASFVMVQVGAIMAIIGLLHITGINIFLLGVAIGFNNLLNGLGLAVLFRVIHGLIGRVLGFLAGAAIGKLLVFAANIGLAHSSASPHASPDSSSEQPSANSSSSPLTSASPNSSD